MTRTNIYLLAGVVLLLAASVVAGQLEFRRTHPAAPPSPSPAAEAPAAGPGAVPEGAPEGASLSAADLDQGPGPNDGKPFPAEVVGLPRTKYLTGEAALAEVSKLHGREIEAGNAEIATYGDDRQQITIYMTNSPDKAAAQALFQAMVERMMANPTAYTRPEVLNIKNKAYFATSGNGQNHYFYLRGTRIYWVSLKLPMDKIMGAMSFVVNQL